MWNLGLVAPMVERRSGYGIAVDEFARLEFPGEPIGGVDARLRLGLEPFDDSMDRLGQSVRRRAASVRRALGELFGAVAGPPLGPQRLLTGLFARTRPLTAVRAGSIASLPMGVP
ncbi:MAG: hypothetical protein L3K09_00365 [Thermoplasmata archaeon]|nr:hypothetical protein [Thermoplasmata archaeon]